MLKTMKTTAITTIAALTIAGGLSSQANAQTTQQFAENVQFQSQLDADQFGERSHQSSGFTDVRRDRSRNDNNDKVIGGVIGAVAGGVIGSQISGNGARTEGSIIGALIGGVAGAAIADNKDDRVRDTKYVDNRRFNQQRRYNNRLYDRYGNSSFGHGIFGHDRFNSRLGGGRYSNLRSFSRHRGFSSHRGFNRNRSKASVFKRRF